MSESAVQTSSNIKMELDTYRVLDCRASLGGRFLTEDGWAGDVLLTLTTSADGKPVWQGNVTLDATGETPFSIALHNVPGGSYTLTASADGIEPITVTLVVGEIDESVTRSPDFQQFLVGAVDTILQDQTKPFLGKADGVPIICNAHESNLSYRSLGAKVDGKHVTFWFPEKPMETDARRVDHSIWPLLDRLSNLTGDERYSDMLTQMLAAIETHSFDEKSGLFYMSEEADLDATTGQGIYKGASADWPRFKPPNTNDFPMLALDRLWQAFPEKMHRACRAMFVGLITDRDRFDYNRFCDYGFDDQRPDPFMPKNAGYCAFDSAGAQLIHWWCDCWARTGDSDCLQWAQQMADKWHAVQHRESGLAPNFFGARPDLKTTDQPPGEWVETRGSALTSATWLRAAKVLEGRAGGEALYKQLLNMGTRLARGVALFAYDPTRRIFREHLQLDGEPFKTTARYCFRTQAEKDAAVAEDPQLKQVAVYDGCGWFANPSYHDINVGSRIPWQLSQSVALCSDVELTELIAGFALDALEEAGNQPRAFTKDGMWTFRASADYTRMFLNLFKVTGDSAHFDAARTLLRREVDALSQVKAPDWWRGSSRTAMLDALLAFVECEQTS